MTVADAIAQRRSTRAFLPDAVDTSWLQALIKQAAHAPSGGNLQPWHVYLLNGPAMAAFRAQMAPRIAAGQIDPLEYPIYPTKLAEPYRSRRYQVGEAMYGLLGIPREDKMARLQWFSRNYDFFGAPAGLFLFVDRSMGAAQWSDLGMFLQTLMLLLVEEGLASCAQEAWAVHHRFVSDYVNAPAEQMLFCGMAIGHPDPDAPVNTLMTPRAPLGEWLTVLE